MCLPDGGTPIEIIHAAWRFAQKEGVSHEGLIRLAPELSVPIKAAAARCAEQLSVDGLGLAVGSDCRKAVDSPSSFIPRSFILGLYSIGIGL